MSHGVGLGFQFLSVMTCLGVIYHIQKDSLSFDTQNPPKMFDFWNFFLSDRRLTRPVRVPPYEILVFPMNFIIFSEMR